MQTRQNRVCGEIVVRLNWEFEVVDGLRLAACLMPWSMVMVDGANDDWEF